MAIVKIFEVVLYTNGVQNAAECHEAKAWLDHSGIEHIHLHYGDASQHEEVLNSLNTWWQGKVVSKWPFVTFKEQQDNLPVVYATANFIEGFENIKSQLPELYALGR